MIIFGIEGPCTSIWMDEKRCGKHDQSGAICAFHFTLNLGIFHEQSDPTFIDNLFRGGFIGRFASRVANYLQD